MDEASSFFAMGGYAAFVWPAFGVSAAVLLGLWLESLARLRAGQRRLARLQAERSSRHGQRAKPPPVSKFSINALISAPSRPWSSNRRRSKLLAT